MLSKQELLKSKHFCILPFIHSCIWTDGRVVPCCINQHHVLGNVKEKSLDEIYSNNNEKLVEIRREMINGPVLPRSCQRCSNMENGYAENSYRHYTNKDYGHLLDSIEINPDGTVEENKILMWDVRFSNLCNLKCRTCSDVNSTKIAEESRKYINNNVTVLTEAFDDKNDFLNFFKKHIDSIEEIYFCGGEPLLLEEHYEILDLLIEYGKSDTILRYNTNCTRLTFKNKNVVDDYWSKFKNIRLGLSIDAGWEQLHYIRGGADWDTVVNNLRYIVKNCSHAFVQLSTTISILNVFHVRRLHKFLVEEKLIGLNDVYYNVLTWPRYYSLTALPTHLKEKVKLEYQDYKNEMIVIGGNYYLENEINKVIKYVDTGDHAIELAKFKQETEFKDKIRQESFVNLFPELQSLYDK